MFIESREGHYFLELDTSYIQTFWHLDKYYRMNFSTCCFFLPNHLSPFEWLPFRNTLVDNYEFQSLITKLQPFEVLILRSANYVFFWFKGKHIFSNFHNRDKKKPEDFFNFIKNYFCMLRGSLSFVSGSEMIKSPVQYSGYWPFLFLPLSTFVSRKDRKRRHCPRLLLEDIQLTPSPLLSDFAPSNEASFQYWCLTDLCFTHHFEGNVCFSSSCLFCLYQM